MGSIADNLDSYASSTWMTKNSRNSRPWWAEHGKVTAPQIVGGN